MTNSSTEASINAIADELSSVEERFDSAFHNAETLINDNNAPAFRAYPSFFSIDNIGLWLLWATIFVCLLLLFSLRRYLRSVSSRKPRIMPMEEHNNKLPVDETGNMSLIHEMPARLVKEPKVVTIKVRKITRRRRSNKI